MRAVIAVVAEKRLTLRAVDLSQLVGYIVEVFRTGCEYRIAVIHRNVLLTAGDKGVSDSVGLHSSYAVDRLAVLVPCVACVAVEVVTDAYVFEQLFICPLALFYRVIRKLELMVYHHVAVEIHTPAHVEVVQADVARSEVDSLVLADCRFRHNCAVPPRLVELETRALVEIPDKSVGEQARHLCGQRERDLIFIVA